MAIWRNITGGSFVHNDVIISHPLINPTWSITFHCHIFVFHQYYWPNPKVSAIFLTFPVKRSVFCFQSRLSVCPQGRTPTQPPSTMYCIRSAMGWLAFDWNVFLFNEVFFICQYQLKLMCTRPCGSYRTSCLVPAAITATDQKRSTLVWF